LRIKRNRQRTAPLTGSARNRVLVRFNFGRVHSSTRIWVAHNNRIKLPHQIVQTNFTQR